MIMTIGALAVIDDVHGQDAQETKRVLCGTHIAPIAMAVTRVNSTVQVACSLTGFSLMVSVTSAETLMSPMLIKTYTLKLLVRRK